jgi:hypothetical protein
LSEKSTPASVHVYTLGTSRCHRNSTDTAIEVGPGWSVFQGDEASAGTEGETDPARRTGWITSRVRSESAMVDRCVRRR